MIVALPGLFSYLCLGVYWCILPVSMYMCTVSLIDLTVAWQNSKPVSCKMHAFLQNANTFALPTIYDFSRNMKISEFLSETFQFLVVKISIYLIRHVFVMRHSKSPRRSSRECFTVFSLESISCNANVLSFSSVKKKKFKKDTTTTTNNNKVQGR